MPELMDVVNDFKVEVQDNAISNEQPGTDGERARS